LLGHPLSNAVIGRAYRDATGERVKLPPARLQFTGRDYLALMSRFFHLSGYSGWVILFDEFELVCKLGTMARGRAYANLYDFLRSRSLPGFEQTIAVVTLIDQMTSEYLLGGKEDVTRVPAFFQSRAYPDVAEAAEKAIRWLAQRKLPLLIPRPHEVDAILDRI